MINKFSTEWKLTNQIADHQYQQALLAVQEHAGSDEEKVEMLIEIAMGLQQKPKSAQQLFNAVALYDEAQNLCPEVEIETIARIEARRGTALQAIPSEDAEYLEKAVTCYRRALDLLPQVEYAEEVGEIEMNLGLALQSLSGLNKAPITEAISAYQRALRVFTKHKYPTEFSIIHNNLATAFLSIPMVDEKAKMREAMAVQSFEAALEVITIIDNPSEFAMLQNNLGNALQYVTSSHGIENKLRALDAYDEALRVRNPHDTPLEYANTISNKANCLMNLPDDLENPEAGNENHLTEANRLYLEARYIFQEYDDKSKCQAIDEVLADLTKELGHGKGAPKDERGFGTDRVH